VPARFLVIAISTAVLILLITDELILDASSALIFIVTFAPFPPNAPGFFTPIIVSSGLKDCAGCPGLDIKSLKFSGKYGVYPVFVVLLELLDFEEELTEEETDTYWRQEWVVIEKLLKERLDDRVA
jgi:hypothetical protein